MRGRSSRTSTDRICSLKGGSNAYNVNGGVEAGSWVQSDHALTLAEIPAHTHSSTGAHTHSIYKGKGSVGTYTHCVFGSDSNTGSSVVLDTGGEHTHDSFGSGNSHNHGSTHRLYAAIGTRQYMAGLT